MTSYALVENGTIIAIRDDIPESFRGISNFKDLSPEEIKAQGFLPYIHEDPSYDIFTQRIGETSYVITADSVTAVTEVVNLSTQEVAMQKSSVVGSAAGLLNKMLYDTDWIYSPDSGLDATNLQNYIDLRASIQNVKNILPTLKGTQVQNMLTQSGSYLVEPSLRLLTFSGRLIELKTFLDTVGHQAQ